ncbi:MAG TPA: nicotinate phosphoribosyltransferase, partial [Polyangiaceae bacterium]|nr:nicotinate phosphoribosyltransferase [Polyangiaceae bacterium]
GLEAGVLAARAAYLAGCAGTSNVEAGHRFGIPVSGTMAHSWVMAFDDEMQAYRQYTSLYGDRTVLLIDTYDTEEGARNVVRLAREGLRAVGVRIDSGDLAEHARRVRAILDAGGLERCTIFASGGLDELAVRELVESGAPIDGFGIGSRLDTSADAPYLDCAYKLVEYAGRPRRKRSEGKATWAGRKQVFRSSADGGAMAFDTLTLEGARAEGEPLLVPMMRGGKRVAPPEPIAASRARAAAQLARLPSHLRALEAQPAYPVRVAPELVALAAEVDAKSPV